MNKKNFSFTLIEIIVVVGLIILMTGLSLATYNKYNLQKSVDAETQKFIDVLELAKKKASAGDVSQCLPGGPLVTPQASSYSVNINPPDQYELVPICPTGTPSAVSYASENNIQFNNNTFSAEFKSLTGSVVLRSTCNSGQSCTNTDYDYACVIIKTNSNQISKYIRVESTGIICEKNCTTVGICRTTCRATPC